MILAALCYLFFSGTLAQSSLFSKTNGGEIQTIRLGQENISRTDSLSDKFKNSAQMLSEDVKILANKSLTTDQKASEIHYQEKMRQISLLIYQTVMLQHESQSSNITDTYDQFNFKIIEMFKRDMKAYQSPKTQNVNRQQHNQQKSSNSTVKVFNITQTKAVLKTSLNETQSKTEKTPKPITTSRVTSKNVDTKPKISAPKLTTTHQVQHSSNSNSNPILRTGAAGGAAATGIEAGTGIVGAGEVGATEEITETSAVDALNEPRPSTSRDDSASEFSLSENSNIDYDSILDFDETLLDDNVPESEVTNEQVLDEGQPREVNEQAEPNEEAHEMSEGSDSEIGEDEETFHVFDDPGDVGTSPEYPVLRR